MNSSLTDITVILDRSGSMQSIRSDAEGGFNAFITQQRKQAGTAHLTLVQFDSEYEEVYVARELEKVPLLELLPRGSTALLDAIGRTLNATGARLKALPEAERPGKVIIVVITDGEENSSREFTLDQVKEMIRHQEDKYAWDFVFVAANQDAITSGAGMGFQAGKSVTFSSDAAGAAGAFEGLSAYTASYRSLGKAEFTEEQRSRAMGETKPKGSAKHRPSKP